MDHQDEYTPPSPQNRQETKGRIGVYEMAYCQQPGDQPATVETRFTRLLKSGEQSYVRRVTVGEDWLPLDVGWLADKCGMVLLTNEEGRGRQVIPSPEEEESIRSRVVEVGIRLQPPTVPPGSGPFPPVVGWLLPPGEGMRGTPAQVGSLCLRCRKGSARVLIVSFPV